MLELTSEVSSPFVAGLTISFCSLLDLEDAKLSAGGGANSLVLKSSLTQLQGFSGLLQETQIAGIGIVLL